MTTQSMPISRERKDYIQSAFTLIAISLVSVLGVYFTHPKKLRPNATTSLLGIEFPNFQGIVMRQPRMTIVLFIGFSILATGFVFIGRQALPFFSRSIAWGAAIVSGIALGAVGFFTKTGSEGGWFRFLLLATCFIGGSTILAEAMIFYRRFIHDRPFRTKLFHKIAFAVICSLLSIAMSGAYYHYAVKEGLFLNYGVSSVAPNPSIPDVPSTPVPTQSSDPAVSNPFGSVPGSTTP